ncbi:nodulation protein H-like isoform X2 [Phoenix dactylifera]|uniref:Nodulation protein H-like isoform X2 n=1 Tax=Phoenix dactylifera TaxID=42345 RepID=A0A8B7BFG2_PHODC|nr:nodulation protein H-like isoform X2 [Phoenix dactylifera]
MQDSLLIKPPKKYPLVLWMAALALVMISGVYICILYLKQKWVPTMPNPIMLRLKEPKPCPDPGIPQSEVPYVHYPEPTTYSRNECACTPVWFFAILSMQRSGSGWFETLLNSHVNVSSNGEIFSVKERRSNISSILQTLDEVYNLDWYSSASKNECTAAVGFKWMLNQGVIHHHDEIVKYFNQRGVSAIFLFRRNLLRRMVSVLANMHDRGAKQLNGTHKAHVHSRDEADVLARYKPTINVNSLVPELKQMDKWGADALDYFKSTRHILLYYEDLVNNRKKVKDVLKFLRLPKRKLSSRHVKIHRRPLSDQVENWDAVYDTLKGTEYESFLHADYQMQQETIS